MSDIFKKSAILLLEDGSIFHGKAAGVVGTTTGELCFNTGMTGYQEIFTDPSYYGQVLIATNAHIGNYGIKNADVESDSIKISGFVCKNFTDSFSRPMADSSIQTYFEKNKLVAISDVDTRAIVRHIRSKGAMNCIISSEIQDVEVLKARLKDVPSMNGLELSSLVTTNTAYTLGDENSSIRISALDFGIKKNILKCLVERGCYVKVFPAKTSFQELASFNPNGYFVSNGPGDPSAMDYAIKVVQDIISSKKPLFGICLGHQLICLALGMKTYKMHNGHRGINHPVFNTISGLSEITSQNHGFAVDANTIINASQPIEITHRNLNDDTVEGIRTKDNLISCVQYHPESSPGPHDSRYLFDNFLTTIQLFDK